MRDGETYDERLARAKDRNRSCAVIEFRAPTGTKRQHNRVVASETQLRSSRTAASVYRRETQIIKISSAYIERTYWKMHDISVEYARFMPINVRLYWILTRCVYDSSFRRSLRARAKHQLAIMIMAVRAPLAQMTHKRLLTSSWQKN